MSEKKERRAYGTGHVLSNGYLEVFRDGRRQLAHRVAMEEQLGRPLLPSESVHHRNGDKLDNRPENLELWSKRQPNGQRIGDLLVWAKEIIALYGDQDAGQVG